MSTGTYYRYSNSFKQKVIREIEDGLISIAEASRIYDISVGGIYKWLRSFGKNHLTCPSGQAGRKGSLGAKAR